MQDVEDGTAPKQYSEFKKWLWFIVAWVPVILFIMLEAWLFNQVMAHFQ